MSDVVIEGGSDDTDVLVETAVTAALAEHEAGMAQETADEALAVAETALAVAVADTHVCRCDEVEARVMAALAALQTEVEDVAMAEVIDAAAEAEPVEEPAAPPPPKKEEPVAEEPKEEAKPAGRGVSKSWFGSRAR